MQNRSVTTAAIVCLLAVSKAADVGAQAFPSVRELPILLDGLSPSAQVQAKAYLMAADSGARRVALTRLMRATAQDSAAFTFFGIASRADPCAWVRAGAVHAIGSAWTPTQQMRTGHADEPGPSVITLQTMRAYLASIVHADIDSIVVAEALDRLRALAVIDTTLRSVLTNRIVAAMRRGERVPDWILAQEQRELDVTRGYMLPSFMRVAPPVMAVSGSKTDRVRFFAIGDWGVHGDSSQLAVAAAIRAEHRRTPFTFGITLGDNFYPKGIESPRSQRWQVEYEHQYGSLGVPVYAVLGNHDYYNGDSPAAQIAYSGYSRTWRLPATHYTFVVGPASAPLVQFFVLDSQTPALLQLQWLDSALAGSTARWKVVAAHYDVYSNRAAGTSAWSRLLIPYLRRHAVTLYLNGHNHTLQHYQVDGIDYMTSAGGGAGLYPTGAGAGGGAGNHAGQRFATSAHGFAIIDVTSDRLRVTFHDLNGIELYKYDRQR